MKPSNSVWDIFWDKAIDGLFIFLGAYVALYLSQWQEDQTKKKELQFHLSQILKQLPEKDIDTVIPVFKLDQGRDENGRCHFNQVIFSADDTGGTRYLGVIQSRGLGNYFPSDRTYILSFLSYYYDDVLPKAIKAKNVFYEKLQTAVLQLSQKGCADENEIAQAERGLANFYRNYKVTSLYAEGVGYKLGQELKSMGIKEPDARKTISISYKFEFDETDTEKKKK